jgi:hypothetical protein
MDFLWRNVTFWWVNSISSTNGTVGWRLSTDVTLGFTSTTDRNTTIIVVILTWTSGRTDSGVIGTSDTSVISSTVSTSIVTWFTVFVGGVIISGIWTNTSMTSTVRSI